MVSNLIIAENGKYRNAADAEFAEKLVDLRKQKDPWEVIDQLVRTWFARSPEEAQATKINVGDMREMLTDSKFGQTHGGKDMERRFTLLFPTTLMLMIRTQFKVGELPFDRKFYREFVKRYPMFKVPEHI